MRAEKKYADYTNNINFVAIKPYQLKFDFLSVVLFLITLAASPSLAEKLKEERYPEFKNKTVRNISVNLRDIFDHQDPGFIYRVANQAKINTKDEVVRRELTIKEGQKFSEAALEESERNVRLLRYLRYVKIEPVAVANDPDAVDLVVNVQDTWTIVPQLGYSSGTGRSKFSVGVIEYDLLGYGKKVGLLYEEEENRSSVQGLYEDNRLWGTKARLATGYFDRSDGEVAFLTLETPFRSLADKSAWSFDAHDGDTVGRLFEAGDERYIFRQKNTALNARYSIARGDPEKSVQRLSFGYDYIEDTFEQADAQDYEDLDLDPDEVSNDPAGLAEDRRYVGPSLAYRFIEPDYISKNYVDRFERVEDFNLGEEYSINSQAAPQFLGSKTDTYLFSANRSGGKQFSKDDFIRGEVGFASRFDEDGMHNSLYRGELKYYNVLGPKYLGERFIGRHTIAFSTYLDYGDDLDRDRELSVGGDFGVRGYEAKSFNGNKRVGFNLEDRVHLIDDAFKLVSIGAAAFFDAGGASYDSFGNIITDQLYSDVGVGLRIAFPRSIGSQVLRVDVAFPLRDGPDGSAQFEPRILFSGGQLFSSRLRSETAGAEKASVDIGFDR